MYITVRLKNEGNKISLCRHIAILLIKNLYKTLKSIFLNSEAILANFNYCGRWTKLEEYGVFQEADPNNKMRPDISINNPVGSSKRKQLLDVSIVSPRLP